MSLIKTELGAAHETISDQFNDRSLTASFEDWQKDFPEVAGLDLPATTSGERAITAQPEIVFEGKLFVNGYLAGEISSENGEMVIDGKGEVHGDISVPTVTIYGSVRGDIRAEIKVELASSARVIGDIETAELLIQPGGAIFIGHCVFPKASLPQTATESLAAVEEDKALAFAIG